MTNLEKPVPSAEYDKTYFLTDCGGHRNFLEHRGLCIDDRMSRSLRMAGIRPGMTILDVGCGRGEIALHCALKKATVIGIDYSEDAITLANELKKGYELSGRRISLLRGSATQLPFKGQVFDRIFLLDIVEHLHQHELDALFASLYSLLKDDGLIIIHTFPNRRYYNNGYPAIRFLLKLLSDIHINVEPRTCYEKKMHVFEQTPGTLSRILKKHGYLCQHRLFDSGHAERLLSHHLSSHRLFRILVSIVRSRWLSGIFCTSIYAAACNASPNCRRQLRGVFTDFKKPCEYMYTVHTKEDIVEEVLADYVVLDKIGVLGEGWHNLELWPGDLPIRWTSDTARAFISNDKPESMLKIKYYSSQNLSFDVCINGRQILRETAVGGCWQILEARLSDQGVIEISLHTDQAWVPDHLYKNGDRRVLGIAIEKIWIE